MEKKLQKAQEMADGFRLRRGLLLATIMIVVIATGTIPVRAHKGKDTVRLLSDHSETGAVYVYVSPSQCTVCDLPVDVVIQACKRNAVPVRLFVEKSTNKQAMIAAGDRHWDADVTGDEMLLYKQHFKVKSSPEAIVVSRSGSVLERASLFQASSTTISKLEKAIRTLSMNLRNDVYPDWAQPLRETSSLALSGVDIDSLGDLLSMFPKLIWDESKDRYFIVNSLRKSTYEFDRDGAFRTSFCAVPKNTDYQPFDPSLVSTVNDSTGLYFLDSDVKDAIPFVYRYDLRTDSAVYHRVLDDSIFVSANFLYDPRQDLIYDGFSPYYGAPERKKEDHTLSVFKHGRFYRFLGTPPDEVYDGPFSHLYYRVLTTIKKDGIAFMSTVSDSIYHYDYTDESLKGMRIVYPDSASEKWHRYYQFKGSQSPPEMLTRTGRHFADMLLGHQESTSVFLVTVMVDTTTKRYKRYGVEPAFGVCRINIDEREQSPWFCLPYGVTPHTFKDDMLVCSSRTGNTLRLRFFRIE
jgi:hypothetical protein